MVVLESTRLTDQVSDMTLFGVYSFILVIVELSSSGQYLLVEVEDGSASVTTNNVSGVQARFPIHLPCWNCIYKHCKQKTSGKVLYEFEMKCQKYGNKTKYPSTRDLLICGQSTCQKAANDIEEECMWGGLGGRPTNGPCYFRED